MVVRTCNTCGARKTKRYCKVCKAARERARYARNPAQERARKRTEYERKKQSRAAPVHAVKDAIIIGERMTAQTATECDHSAAVQEREGIFFCPLCGTWFDLDGNTVADPTEAEKVGEPQAKKHAARDGNETKRAYKRDESLKIEVKCSHPNCNKRFKVWPQNAKTDLDCPQIHRPLKKLEQARQRQIRWRQNHR